MPNKTVLSDAAIQQAAQCLVAEAQSDGETVTIKNVNQCLRNIEQAVLQSPEIQQLRKDAERLDSGCIMTHEQNDFGEEYMCERRGIDLRAAIDAAMEQKC